MCASLYFIKSLSNLSFRFYFEMIHAPVKAKRMPLLRV